MNQESSQLLKGGLAVSTLTGSVYLVYFQSILACIGIVVAITLSIVAISKTRKEIKWNDMLGEAKLEDIRFRQKKDLPVRRKSDEVIK